MRKVSKNQLLANMRNEGFHFQEFSQVHEGGYAIDDADWNYKDIPHLHHVHELAEAVPTMISDDFIATVNTQKVLFFKFPLALFNYESGPNAQTYYATWLWYVLVIETCYEKLEEIRTRVTTTYSIGSPSWLKWTFPILRWVLTRNYHNLMSADIPMRERKGDLRRRGFTFLKPAERYSFEKTTMILRSNVWPPAGDPNQAAYRLNPSQRLPADGETMIGENDHLGFRLVRTGDAISVYPRLCPHEGACLDTSRLAEGKLTCPWHGRVFKSLGEIHLRNPQTQVLTSDFARIQFEQDEIQVFSRA